MTYATLPIHVGRPHIALEAVGCGKSLSGKASSSKVADMDEDDHARLLTDLSCVDGAGNASPISAMMEQTGERRAGW